MRLQKGETNPGTILIGIILLALVGGLLFPRMNWGRMSWSPAETVTVTGQAKTSQKNQIAVFTAGVEVVSDKKDEAIKEVNSKVDELIAKVKEFGVDPKDIKTQNVSVFQNEEMYTERGVQKSRKGQWRVNNSVEIRLRNVDDAGKLTDLLSQTGATNVWGPNFQFDDTSEIEKGLYDQAIKDAKDRAEIIAKSSGRKLGKVLSVNESGTVTSLPMMNEKFGMGGGASLEPGTGTVSKAIVVTFELK